MTTVPMTKQTILVPRWTRQQVDLLKRTVAKGLTDDEFALYTYVAKRVGLDPFLKQIYAIKRFDSDSNDYRMAIQTGIDGFRLLADRSGQVAGVDLPLFDMDPSHPERPEKATVVVYKFVNDERVAYSGEARWKEFAQKKKDGSYVRMWDPEKGMPFNQLAKCAEAAAWRKGFPVQIGSLMSQEEMPVADYVELPGGESKPETSGAFHAGTLYEGTIGSFIKPDGKRPGKLTVVVEGVGESPAMTFFKDMELPAVKIGDLVQVSYVEKADKKGGRTFINLEHLALVPDTTDDRGAPETPKTVHTTETWSDDPSGGKAEPATSRDVDQQTVYRDALTDIRGAASTSMTSQLYNDAADGGKFTSPQLKDLQRAMLERMQELQPAGKKR